MSVKFDFYSFEKVKKSIKYFRAFSRRLYFKRYFKVIKNNLRKTDIIGRWEEKSFDYSSIHFKKDIAKKNAENLRALIEENNFSIR